MADLVGGLREATLKRAVLAVDAGGGEGEVVDETLQARGVGRRIEFALRARERAAEGLVGRLRRLDRLGDALQLARQLVARVANLVVQPQAGQVLRRKLLAHVVGDGFADAEQPLDLLRERPFGLREHV